MLGTMFPDACRIGAPLSWICKAPQYYDRSSDNVRMVTYEHHAASQMNKSLPQAEGNY